MCNFFPRMCNFFFPRRRVVSVAFLYLFEHVFFLVCIFFFPHRLEHFGDFAVGVLVISVVVARRALRPVMRRLKKKKRKKEREMKKREILVL